MVNRMQFYIDGAWVDPVVKKSTPVVNPATEEAMYEIALGSKADVDKAVAAARRAFETYSQTSREERVALLSKIIEVYKTRMKDIGAAVSDEMGAPLPMAEKLQAGAGLGTSPPRSRFSRTITFEEPVGSAVVVREPVGVIGMITPWNWPLNQIACKVAPALAAGCTMILKPSEFTPSSALIFAEILHEAGRAEGRVQPDQRARARGRRRHERAPGYRHDLVHRLDPRRHRCRQARRADREARQPGTGRQVAERHPRRRRSDQGRHRRRHAHVQQFRTVVQRAVADDRAAVEDEGSRRHRQGRRRQDQGRRSARRRHHHRPGREPRSSGTRSRR